MREQVENCHKADAHDCLLSNRERLAMNRPSISICRLLVITLFVLTVAAANGQETAWHKTLAEAEAAAQRDQVPLLIHFHAWYCAPCRQMDSQVFRHGDVQQALSKGLHAVQIDVTQNPDAASRYGATTVPRDVVVYPDRSVVTLNVGFVPRLKYLAMLKNTSARGNQMRRDHVPLPSSGTQSIAAADQPTADHSQSSSNSESGSAVGGKTLGLNGYCPVRLTVSRKWVKGNSELTAEYRGVTYYFSNASDHREFEQNPGKFAPKNLGCDPVLLYKDQRAISGQIAFGAFFDGSLYLFRDNGNRAEFRKNPLRYTRIRHAIRIDEIEGRRVL
jgi:YHS domain-containing protein